MPLALERVSKSYPGNRTVLKDVDLKIADGETLAVMGPSGSGKTTLLSILGLLIEPSSGTLLLDDQCAPIGERDRHFIRSSSFGWVLQTVNVLSRRTAVDNVAVPLLAAGASRVEAMGRAIAALSEVGLGHVVEAPVRLLSGGEVQRVCIARALAHKPRFLLADEPTGQLDHGTSVQVLDALRRLILSTGSTLVVATHDPAVAAECGRVIQLLDGRAYEQ